MKGQRRKVLAAVLAAALASPCAAAPPLTNDVLKSTAPAARSAPLIRFDFQKGTGGRASVGVKGGLKEGKPLEMLTWGAGGAVVGSLAGPFGAAVGGAAGAVVGLLVSIFVVPREKTTDSHPD